MWSSGNGKQQPLQGMPVLGQMNAIEILEKVLKVLEWDESMKAFTAGDRFGLCLEGREKEMLLDAIQHMRRDLADGLNAPEYTKLLFYGQE